MYRQNQLKAELDRLRRENSYLKQENIYLKEKANTLYSEIRNNNLMEVNKGLSEALMSRVLLDSNVTLVDKEKSIALEEIQDLKLKHKDDLGTTRRLNHIEKFLNKKSN